MTPRQRVLKRALLESLRRYRQFGELSGPEFESQMADYPAFLRATADEYELAPAELAIEEKPGLTGYSDWAETYDDEPNNPVIAGEELVFDKLLARLSAASRPSNQTPRCWRGQGRRQPPKSWTSSSPPATSTGG